MKKEELMDAIGDIRDEYVEEAEDYGIGRAAEQQEEQLQQDSVQTAAGSEAFPALDAGSSQMADSNSIAGNAGKNIWNRRNMRRIAAMAAGLCVLVVGGYVWSVQGLKNSDTTSGVAGAYDFGNTDAGAVDEKEAASGDVESAEDAFVDNSMGSAKVDYHAFFKDVSDETNGSNQETAVDYTLEAGGANYTYESMEAIPQLPFDTSMFTAGTTALYAKADDTIANINLNFNNEQSGRYLSITISESGEYFSCYELKLENGTERYGTLVYGFDRSAYSDTTSLELYFTMSDGSAYNISSSGLSYEELGGIMDAILQQGITPDLFDLTKAVKKETKHSKESIAQVNEKGVFADELVSIEQVGDLTRENTTGSNFFTAYENDVAVWYEYDLCYSNADYDYINVSYTTNRAAYEDDVYVHVPRSNLNKETVVAGTGDSDTSGNKWYDFIIDYENYIVSVTGNCTEEEMWEYLNQLPE